MTIQPDNEREKHYEGTTIVLPQDQFKDVVGVDSDTFAATTREKDYYQGLIDEREIQEKGILHLLPLDCQIQREQENGKVLNFRY